MIETIVVQISEDVDYSFIFSKETSKEWAALKDVNSFFLECQERYANHMLASRGYVFLNDILHCLGLKRTRVGAVTGWSLGKSSTISFGKYKEQVTEEEIKLVFNVTGVIINDI